MKVSLNLSPAKGCQPLKFGEDKDNSKPVDFNNTQPSAEKQLDMACKVIAAQNLMIDFLNAQKSGKLNTKA